MEFSEGLKVDIIEDKKKDRLEKKIVITFRDQKWNVTIQDLARIIEEKDEFNEKVKKALEENSNVID